MINMKIEKCKTKKTKEKKINWKKKLSDLEHGDMIKMRYSPDRNLLVIDKCGVDSDSVIEYNAFLIVSGNGQFQLVSGIMDNLISDGFDYLGKADTLCYE